MSGALIQLVSKGVQDAYIMGEEGHSFFRTKFMRHTNFSQVPKFIKSMGANDTSITIPVLGDIINAVWFEKSDTRLMGIFNNSTISLYIGGQKIDSQHFDYYTDIWPTYLSDTYSKSKELNSSGIYRGFLPLQFFFCNHKAFLPLVALQKHQIEIKIDFDPNAFNGLTETQSKYEVYGNYIFLDKDERESIVKRSMDLVITQVQRLEHPLNTGDGYITIDISQFNHPVKSLFFGFAKKYNYLDDYFKFSGVDLQINGTPLFENMTPVYFHSVQNYYKSEYGVSGYDDNSDLLMNTRYYVYHFCMNASQYSPSGSCNFSRLDNAKMIIRGAQIGVTRMAGEPIYVYAVNYNVLRIRDGLAGILFGN